MPELPEVEVVRRGLERWVAGRTVAVVEPLHARAVRRHAGGAEDFADRLRGRTFGVARRRGKYLWIPLVEAAAGGEPQAAAEAIVGHLGMSGQLLIQAADAPDEVHLRIRITFTDGDPQLRFVDQRTFGGLSLDTLVGSDPASSVPSTISHIARDPLDGEFDDAAFIKAFRAKSTGVKRALLDQNLISGVGNIYADEALWRARVHYERACDSLTRPEAVRLLGAAREVMQEALAVGGTSFDALYVNVNGESGYFSRSLNAYGQEGRPCSRCGTEVLREAFMNRSSFFCPRCQRPKAAVRKPAAETVTVPKGGVRKTAVPPQSSGRETIDV
jgi:formamidopyrimidine-DNA glycosylase